MHDLLPVILFWHLVLAVSAAEWLPRISLLQGLLGALTVATPLAWRYAVKPVVAFMRQWKACVADVGQIKAALMPNGGRSLYDKVDMAARSSRINQARISTMFDV